MKKQKKGIIKNYNKTKKINKISNKQIRKSYSKLQKHKLENILKHQKETRKTKQNNIINLKDVTINNIGSNILIEEILINKLIISKQNKSYKNKVNEYFSENSMLLKNLIINFTGTLSKLNYKNGLFAGKLLYHAYNKIYNYASYNDALWHLIEFLESCGYKNIVFTSFPDKITIKIPNIKQDLNLNTHVFEAGLISGFITASKNKLLFAKEAKCSNNNSDFCEFICDEYNNYNDFRTNSQNIDKSIEKFIESYLRDLNRNKRDAKTKINYSANIYPESYYYLSSFPIIFNNKLNNYMKLIFTHIAIKFNQNLLKEFKTITKKNQKNLFEQIQQILGLLDITVTINSLKPLNISLMFNYLNSKKEFIDLSIIFFNNLANGYINTKNTATQLKNINGKYILTIS
ncbi:MAG: hypothetical protein M1168_03420 [Candidatus Marsarchaeota archaeon]|nr:hypothetical protein [Candidatus Marsarchaeota archaeon]MCL5095004.1 hypothetical protein [Candidatus Marsarchaeota archaeon]